MIWAGSWRYGRLVTWFHYQLIAKSGNKTAVPPRPQPYKTTTDEVGYLPERVEMLNWFIYQKLWRRDMHQNSMAAEPEDVVSIRLLLKLLESLLVSYYYREWFHFRLFKKHRVFYQNNSSVWRCVDDFNSFDATKRIFRITLSIACLLMPRPGHQQAWYWQYRIDNMKGCSIVNLIFFWWITY